MIDILNSLGLNDVNNVYLNKGYDELIEYELNNNEVKEAKNGACVVDTGIFTGRSPNDKYFVLNSYSKSNIAWESNNSISKEVFDELFVKVKKSYSNNDLFITDVYCGVGKSRRSIRFVTQKAWKAHFVRNLFIRPNEEELKDFKPDFTFYNASEISNTDFEKDKLNSEVFVIFNIEENMAILGGTHYGGEMKKGIFSMMNYWLPLKGDLGMHCSANVGKENDVALFFGLSGTGKTTLSTDEHRKLIGDDEHGWDEDGIFNFEGGCYAKVIDLDPKSEPQIYNAIRRNALLENVSLDANLNPKYEDSTKTENTRVSYPIFHIDNHEPSLKGSHPKNIIFLTCDAFGVLPPVSKLSKEQAMYYFLSGYTAKVAGTERGVTEPTATFSACFGEAFLPLCPTVYAKLLGEKINKHNVNVYLVNTGWVGGSYGLGKRMSIKNTRACINAILDGSIQNSDFSTLDIFNLQIPKDLKGVDSDILNPKSTWKDKDEYEKTLLKLAKLFINNFKKYISKNSSFDFSSFGPKI